MTTPALSTIINGWRIAGWGGALALLALPALAMLFTPEVIWTPGDFVTAAIMLMVLGCAVELAFHFAASIARRAGLLLFSLAAVLTFWANGAVGIIGNEGEAINLGFYVLVLAASLVAIILRFSGRAMMWLCGLLAIGQFAMGVAALKVMPGHQTEWGVLGFFALLWLAGAACFYMAQRDQSFS